MTKEIIKIKNLSKVFSYNQTKISILEEINFNLFQGDIVSIIGPSGSGKSTFLNILGFLDSSYCGEYRFLGKNIIDLKISEKNIIRNTSIGFVHQFFHLIPELTVLENVALPNLIQNKNKLNSYKISKEILDNFGLSHHINSKPQILSGGEQQRVAIARSLINKPSIIIADEMTGNLDEKNSNQIFKFFIEQVRINKQSLIYVTHNSNYSTQALTQYKIVNKKLKLLK